MDFRPENIILTPAQEEVISLLPRHEQAYYRRLIQEEMLRDYWLQQVEQRERGWNRAPNYVGLDILEDIEPNYEDVEEMMTHRGRLAQSRRVPRRPRGRGRKKFSSYKLELVGEIK